MRLKGWDIIDKVLERNVMFNISKVEDFYIFYLGYSFSCSKEGDDFSQYIYKVEFPEKVYQTHGWHQIIRFHSSNDLNSLELLKRYLEEFKESEFYKSIN